ncbi:MAG: methyltransferase domain-containing protein [Acidobacteriota bacterium]|nr:methyltransferase domain-containing protein [Acidobacteriota bacterium]
MWSPTQYTKFKSERRQPFDDLLALVERRPRMRVIDLGCGPGELTRELHETLAASHTVGVDNSEAMLEKAGAFASEEVRFEYGDIATYTASEKVDLIFSNAAFHWVMDHERLFVHIREQLAPRGQIAVQMPANDSHASHRIAAEVAAKFDIPARPDPLLELTLYAKLLHALGFAKQHVRLQVYGHVLPSSDDVVEWVRGALLTHYEALLTPERYAEFLALYRKRIAEELGDGRPYFYTYKRVLLWASL